jgi:hypothetical protein
MHIHGGINYHLAISFSFILAKSLRLCVTISSLPNEPTHSRRARGIAFVICLNWLLRSSPDSG